MKKLRNTLIGLMLALLARETPVLAQTNIFQMPALFPGHLQLSQDFKQELPKGDYAALERICREGVALLPHDPTWRYNLACMLARQARPKEALDALDEAVALGFRDVRTIVGDSDLATLRRQPRFQKLIEEAERTQNQPPRGQPATAPAVVTDQALVSTSNTVWNFDLGLFQTFFAPAAPKVLTTNDYVQLAGPVGQAIRAWQAAGTAAGNAGDLYDNRDNGHSRLNLALFPEMRPIVYAEAARQAHVDNGLSTFSFNGAVVLGNSSTALRNGPFWRSNARQAYTDGRATLFLSLQYLHNQHYIFPQHRDYLPDVEGDTFPANTPYLTIAPGSSYTDQPLLEAFAATLAALRPDVKAALIREGMLFPTLQMLLRASQKDVLERSDYLTRKAHPIVFDGARIDLLRMVTLAQDLQTNALPPFATLRVLEEASTEPGRDFFDLAGGEGLFDSPAAIARVVRGMAYTRRIVVDGRSSRNPMHTHLTHHWVLLQGDPAKVRIVPRIGEPLIADIEVDYHGGGFASETNNPIRTSRVEIALIVENAAHYSPPAYLTFYYLSNEIRKYADDGRILTVDYANAADRYTDPLISLPRRWVDRYTYDSQNRLTGWSRLRASSMETFTPDGARVLTHDSQGRPATARVVQYMRREQMGDDGTLGFEVVQTDTARVRTYRYADNNDSVGVIAGESLQPAKE